MEDTSDKIMVKDGWVICPVCKKGKLLKIRTDTTAQNLPCKCKLCGQETIVNIGMRLSH